MAFKAPIRTVAVMNDLLPSMKSTWASPWTTSTRPKFISRGVRTATQPSVSTFCSKAAKMVARVGSKAPESLNPVPLSSLQRSSLASKMPRPMSKLRALASSTSPLSAKQHPLRGQIAIPQARAHSTFSTSSLTHNLRFSFVRLPILGPRRTMLGVGSSSQNLLAHMEQTANNNPSSATAQNAFYSALLRADMPAIVAERYQNGRYASNSACENTYQKALEKITRTESATSFGGGTNIQGRNNMSKEQLQAIGQAIAAQSRSAQVAGPKAGSAGTGEKASPLYVVVEESFGSNIFKWVKFILYFGLVGYLSLVVVTVAVEMSGILRKVGSSQANEAQPQNQTVRFSDVHGCEEAKEELQELVEFLKNPEKFSTLGGKLPKGVLLTGPPGTGKTLLARAVAGEAGVPFFFASGSEFDEMYVGVGAKRIRELFSNARAKAPAIIFIDELDAIGSKRVDRDPAYVKQSLNQLLTELDGFSQDTGIIIIAATNLPKLLDKALTRPGRFDRNVVVPLPDVRGRASILKHHMKKVQVGTDVDETLIARGTTGFSGADLENLVNQAAVHASRNKAKKVSMADLDWSKDKIIMGAERRSQIVKEKDKLMTAYHEAGHALVGYYTAAADPMYKVTIMPRGPALGITYYMPEMDKVSIAKNEMLASIDICMGGKVAEEIVYGEDRVTTGCSSDLTNATRQAYNMIVNAGMSPVLGNMDFGSRYNTLSASTKHMIENEVRKTVETGRKNAMQILTEHRAELDMVAKALVEYETLSLEEMKKILKGEKLPKLSSSAPPETGMNLPGIVLPPAIGGMGTGTTTPPAIPSSSSSSNEKPNPPGDGDAGGATV